jgi:hypothetical protein
MRSLHYAFGSGRDDNGTTKPGSVRNGMEEKDAKNN